MASLLCAELIGREAEMDAIDAALGRASVSGGELVLVLGEAGVGKSRLARETLGRALARGMTILFGRASADASPSPFRPLTEALLSSFTHPPDLRSDELAPFAGLLGRVVPEWAVGTGSGDDVNELALGEAVIRVLSSVSDRGRGSLLVLEDLHWADPETIAIVEYLADHLSRTRTMCLATVRTGEGTEMEVRASQLSGRRSAVLLEPRPLGDVEVDRMVATCLGTDMVPAELLRMVKLRAEGVPLVVEELLAGLSRKGALVPDDHEGWRVSGELTTRVPASLADSVARRLDALDDEHRLVIRAAATLGRRFEWTLLAATSGRPERTVIEGLRQAVTAQIVIEDGDTFAFRHALSRDAVLEAMLAPARQRLAASALAAVEAAHPDLPADWCDVAADLAERARDHRRATELRLRTADRALGRGAPASAEASLERARSLVDDDASLLARIDEAAAHAAALGGDVERALELSRAVLAAPGGALDPARRASLLLIVARAALQAGRWADADDRAAEARRLGERAGDERLMATAYAVSAQAAIAERQTERAVLFAREAAELGRRSGAPASVCEALEVLGREARLRDLVEAEGQFQDACHVAERHGLALWRARALHELGTIDLFTTLRTDRLAEARRASIEAGAVGTLALVDLHGAAIALSRFDPEPACQAASSSAELSRRLGLATLPMSLVHLAAAHGLAGREASMESVASEALAAAPDDPEVQAGIPGRARALLHLRHGRWDLARRSLDEAITALRPYPDVWFPFRGLWALLRTVEGLDGEAACSEAESAPGAAIAFNRARLLLARAVLAGRSGHAAAADALVAEADAVAPNPDAVRVWTSLERLIVAPAARKDGWGRPLEWTRQALVLFEERGLAELAGRSRALLRAAGQPVPRRGRGNTDVPPELTGVGVTTREADVLRLLAARLSNKEIGQRLHVSPRTIERHIANLLAKTGAAGRHELAALAERAGITNA